MQNREKKPPINISELSGKKPEAKKGALSYIPQKNSKKPTSRALDINWTQVLVAVIISITLCGIMILLFNA